MTCPCKCRAPQLQFNSTIKWAASHTGIFSLPAFQIRILGQRHSVHAIRGENEGRRIATLLPSCYFWIRLAFLPLNTPSFFPSPHLLHALQAHTNTLTYSEAKARATVGLKPEDLDSRFLIASRLCSLESVRTRENVFVANREWLEFGNSAAY